MERHLPQKPVTSKSAGGKRRKNGAAANLRNVRIAVLGKDGVGKSAFTVRALTRRFIGEYDTKLEFTYKHLVQIDGKNVSLDVFDTAGKNSLEKVDRCVTMGTNIFFVLYSTTDRSSFEEASLLCHYLLKSKNTDPSYLHLIANKNDLTEVKQVEKREGGFLAAALKCGFHQVSVKESCEEIQCIVHNSIRQHLTEQ